MKKSLLFLSTALAAAVVALPLSACGSTPEFKLDDYAVSLDSEYAPSSVLTNNPKLPTATLKLAGTPTESFDNLVSLRIEQNETVKYRLFDLTAQKFVSEKEYDKIHSERGFLYGLTAKNDDSVLVDILSRSGTALISNAYATNEYSLPTASYRYFYIDGEQKYLYFVNYYPSKSAQTPTTKYFVIDSKTKAYTEVSADKLNVLPDDLNAGNQFVNQSKATYLGADLYSEIFTSSLDGWYMQSKVDTVRTSWDGTLSTGTYAFFKQNSNIRNEVAVHNAFELGRFKTYQFYYEMTQVSSDATEGYNVVFPKQDGNDLKYNAVLKRYDITTGESTELKADYFCVEAGTGLYNFKTKDYDAATVSGYKFVDGVAVVSEEAAPFSLIVDKDAKVCADITTKPFDFEAMFFNILKLKENRYFIDGTIVDKNMNVVTELGASARLYADLKVIVGNVNGKAFAVDYDGKIILAPNYSSLNFYGNRAATTVYDKTGTAHEKYVISLTDPQGKAASELVNAPKNSTVEIQGSLIIVTETVTSSSEGSGETPEPTEPTTTIRTTLYNLEGKKLLTVTSDSRPQFQMLGNNTMLVAGSDYYYVY